jgi:hypothetical protein
MPRSRFCLLRALVPDPLPESEGLRARDGVFSLAAGVGSWAAPICGAASPFAGADPVPESGGEEPPIRAVVQV